MDDPDPDGSCAPGEETQNQNQIDLSISSPLVLITGCTGHIGFRVLFLALQSSYTVRAAVRSSSKASSLLTHPVLLSPPPSTKNRLSFIIVPDLTVKHAYDDAVKGVTYIIHIASPLMSAALPGQDVVDFEAEFIRPVVRGTVEMLDSARKEKEKSVKRVVIMSSMTAIWQLAKKFQQGQKISPKGWKKMTPFLKLKSNENAKDCISQDSGSLRFS